MKVYRTNDELDNMLHAGAASSADIELRDEVQHQVAQLKEGGYLDPCDMMTVVQMEVGDPIAALENLMHILVLRNRWTGIGYGSQGFTPSWETAEEYDHWYVVVFVMSDDGFGYLVFVPKDHDSQLPVALKEHIVNQ